MSNIRHVALQNNGGISGLSFSSLKLEDQAPVLGTWQKQKVVGKDAVGSPWQSAFGSWKSDILRCHLRYWLFPTEAFGRKKTHTHRASPRPERPPPRARAPPVLLLAGARQVTRRGSKCPPNSRESEVLSKFRW
jgi:hypothetical protein